MGTLITLITIWLVVMGIYYLCVAMLQLAIKLPAIVIFVLTLPAMPFIVAYRNRVEHPIQANGPMLDVWRFNCAYNFDYHRRRSFVAFASSSLIHFNPFTRIARS